VVLVNNQFGPFASLALDLESWGTSAFSFLAEPEFGTFVFAEIFFVDTENLGMLFVCHEVDMVRSRLSSPHTNQIERKILESSNFLLVDVDPDERTTSIHADVQISVEVISVDCSWVAVICWKFDKTIQGEVLNVHEKDCCRAQKSREANTQDEQTFRPIDGGADDVGSIGLAPPVLKGENSTVPGIVREGLGAVNITDNSVREVVHGVNHDGVGGGGRRGSRDVVDVVDMGLEGRMEGNILRIVLKNDPIERPVE